MSSYFLFCFRKCYGWGCTEGHLFITVCFRTVKTCSSTGYFAKKCRAITDVVNPSQIPLNLKGAARIQGLKSKIAVDVKM